MLSAIILGCGQSGYGAAVLAQQKGFATLVSDNGAIATQYKDLLNDRNIEYEECGHSPQRILSADLIIKSPGIPETVPILCAARARGIEVISEIEFAYRHLPSGTKTICITGSNGKTTTTTLIYEIMRDAGMSVALAGNIGRSMALQVALEDPAPRWYVIELSSFQLDGMYDARADIALLLNITPDHLDRYDYKIENYAMSKFRVTRNQGPLDTFILNADDPLTTRYKTEISTNATILPFSLDPTRATGAWYDATRGELHYKDHTLSESELRIKGRHNIANALAAIAACSKAGVPFDSIRRTLGRFSGVEHRLEYVASPLGVEYINDSKATNVDSVWYALDSMKRPTVWIAGGTDKGNDYSTLLPLVREHVKALVCMGVDNGKLLDAFRDVVPVYDTHSLSEAMLACRGVARRGDTVLLSPACASFDLFQNYEQRGQLFKEAVRAIQAENEIE